MKPNDGGKAFPLGSPFPGLTEYGMTLRDYFAGQALVAIITASTSGHAMPTVWSDTSYKVADAMLAERNRGETPPAVT